MHHIQFRKLETKLKQNRYKDLKHDLQVLLWMFNRFGVSNSSLVFFYFSQILAPFPMKSNEGLNISINPIFPIFFFFNFYFDCLLGYLFLLKPFYFFNGTFFNIWRASPSSFSSTESPCFLLNNFVFPLPPLLVQFVPTRIMLGS